MVKFYVPRQVVKLSFPLFSFFPNLPSPTKQCFSEDRGFEAPRSAPCGIRRCFLSKVCLQTLGVTDGKEQALIHYFLKIIKDII